jgi:hypothetical protein
MHSGPSNEWMELPAPLAGRADDERVLAPAASCSPFGEHRRRSSSMCSAARMELHENSWVQWLNGRCVD